ncbi:MAG: hypothetical protein IPN95_15755 [Bacteroidetes bacterium]|nr:hypothetical protein [Bacteroidota bacterium]
MLLSSKWLGKGKSTAPNAATAPLVEEGYCCEKPRKDGNGGTGSENHSIREHFQQWYWDLQN